MGHLVKRMMTPMLGAADCGALIEALLNHRKRTQRDLIEHCSDNSRVQKWLLSQALQHDSQLGIALGDLYPEHADDETETDEVEVTVSWNEDHQCHQYWNEKTGRATWTPPPGHAVAFRTETTTE